MKHILRIFLINLVALWFTTQLMPGLTYTGGFKSLLFGSLAIMIFNLSIIPLLKIMFLPLNLLTLGFFTWVVNVVGLYLITKILPQFEIVSYTFSGLSLNGVIFPSIELNVLYVAIISSFLVGFISHFLQWVIK
ncbi:phage holin family protein [Candidatus Daviesbacteria bacterium]|nr:phage holin family protein [Candidatus Daviesbacteria bacterium]